MDSQEKRAEKLRSFGYTHIISFVDKIPNVGTITKAFPTTTDAVDRTVARLKAIGMTDVQVNPL